MNQPIHWMAAFKSGPQFPVTSFGQVVRLIEGLIWDDVDRDAVILEAYSEDGLTGGIRPDGSRGMRRIHCRAALEFYGGRE
jgi:hypothetical protein